VSLVGKRGEAFVKRLSTTLVERGIRVCARRLVEDLWSKALWTVWVHPLDSFTQEMGYGRPGCVAMVHQVDPQLLLEIAAIWPPEMPQYRRGYLLKALKRKFEPGNPCFLMRAGGKLCGAVWLTQPSATIRSVLTGLPSKVVMISNLFIAAQKRGAWLWQSFAARGGGLGVG
jgi:hypothetical protein